MNHHNPPHFAQNGFTLLEVMVALFVLSLGLVGLAMLQTVGLKYNTNSYSRTQSTLLAYDIIDRMRANPDAVVGPSGANYDVPDHASADAIAKATAYTDCSANKCDSGTMAKYDLIKWYQAQDRLLPGASQSGLRSTITRPTTASRTVTITLRWMEDDLPEPKEQVWEVEL